MKYFYHLLVNTLVANVTTSFLWFALTFWVYLETESVMAVGLIGGGYMIMVALFSVIFGTIVDQNKKKTVMLASSLLTMSAFAVAGLVYRLLPEARLLDFGAGYFWLFITIILAGAIIENMRNIALSTTVTLLVSKDKRANANGLVGTVQGISFILTSVFSGLSIGLLGMGWTLAIAIVLMTLSFAHLLLIDIPEKTITHDPELAKKRIDIKGSIAAVRVVPGLLALIFFSMFNNFIGGSYMALMDPYGLTLFPVEVWGVVFALAGTGFVIGGMVIAKYGLGKNPIRTLLRLVIIMGLLGAFFTIREIWWLYAVGIWLYMLMIPAIEAAEQTVIQRVVPYQRQGRVFGLAQAMESSAAPLTAFAIAPLAEFVVIPYMRSSEGLATWGWLLGQGEMRGIAMIFLLTGLIMSVVASLAFMTKSYRMLSAIYQKS